MLEFCQLHDSCPPRSHNNPHLVEVAVHTILFVRRLYPVDLFTRKKKWDAPVYQSRHPDLNAYISGAVKAVGEELSHVMLPQSYLDKT
jgi:hypothetical protein